MILWFDRITGKVYSDWEYQISDPPWDELKLPDNVSQVDGVNAIYYTKEHGWKIVILFAKFNTYHAATLTSVSSDVIQEFITVTPEHHERILANYYYIRLDGSSPDYEHRLLGNITIKLK